MKWLLWHGKHEIKLSSCNKYILPLQLGDVGMFFNLNVTIILKLKFTTVLYEIYTF